MNETVKSWVNKAEDDYRVAQRELAVKDRPSFDAVCFHAQQCIEKLMKAVLIQHKTLVPRTHDLLELSRLLHDLGERELGPEEQMRVLSQAAVAYRYPGESADEEDAAQALDICRRLRENLLKSLSIS